MLKEPVLLQVLIEPDQSSMVYQLSMINQTLCSLQCKCWRTNIMADVYLRFAPCGSWWQQNTNVCLSACNH